VAQKRAPLEYNRMWQMRLWLLAVFFFLYAPLVALIAFSFNDSKRNTVWRGFTLNYYQQLFNDQALLIAFANSLTIALMATLISLVIGALAAVLLWRYRFVGKVAVEGAFTLPIVVPEICMGVAMLLFFTRVVPWPNNLIWPLSLGSITIAHVSFCFPFVALVPHMRPALIAGGLLAFTLSLDDFVITFFTSGPDTITFPVKVYSMLRFSVTPEVNAASTMLILLTIVLMIIMMVMQSRAQKK
jgi:spermidine/putrescine transport system permease protein